MAINTSSINLKAFVAQNAPYMTVSDMSEETGVANHNIQKILDALGIKAIKQGQKIENFIMAHYKKKPKKWFQKVCSMTPEQTSLYYRKLGITEPDFDSAIPNFFNRSAREILSSLQSLSDIQRNL